MQFLTEQQVRRIFDEMGEEYTPGEYYYTPETGCLWCVGTPFPIAYQRMQNYGGKRQRVWMGNCPPS